MICIKSSPRGSSIVPVKQETNASAVGVTPRRHTPSTNYSGCTVTKETSSTPETSHTPSKYPNAAGDADVHLSTHGSISKNTTNIKRKRDQDQEIESNLAPRSTVNMKNSPANALLDRTDSSTKHRQFRDIDRGQSLNRRTARESSVGLHDGDPQTHKKPSVVERTQRQSSIHTAPARMGRSDRAQSMGRTRASEAVRGGNYDNIHNARADTEDARALTDILHDDDIDAYTRGSSGLHTARSHKSHNRGSLGGVPGQHTPMYTTARPYSDREYVARLDHQERDRERLRSAGASSVHTRERRSMSQRPSDAYAMDATSMGNSPVTSASTYVHGSSASVTRSAPANTHPYSEDGDRSHFIRVWLGNVESFVTNKLAPLRWQGVWLCVALALLVFGLMGLIRGLYNEVMANDGAFSSANIKIYLQACLYLSVVVAVIGCVVLTYEKLNSAREEKLAEIRYMYQHVMTILERQGDAVLVHVRDEVCESRYDPLWPDVVRRVSADSRVRSRKVCVGGVEQREWVWLAKQRRGGSMLPLSSVSGEALNASVLNASALGPATPLWSLNESSDALNGATEGPFGGVNASSSHVSEDVSAETGLGRNGEKEGETTGDKNKGAKSTNSANSAGLNNTHTDPSTHTEDVANSARKLPSTGSLTPSSSSQKATQAQAHENTCVAKDEDPVADGAFSTNASMVDDSAACYQDPTNSLLDDIAIN
ncbi:hypothetical protein SARC_09071 [Sphaeroforma arctica JP610]|uniref:Uncharacterized protein n=1 Tax=Sphaeroforma arctica JP610 TaxID=667725 RepID=A0A0L0FPQ9_9EUKA|nr:hypothetical protein SARC_09071 [Sphaeroforma arctica JP610]KNC78496.1 hypothetical protein SARC_09071 [Sphaeroforma arctica JP610]|eukprot:XP_014152398.1 hypothetical protein SARC_09071 [Sphaeroforma arctica JP610]